MVKELSGKKKLRDWKGEPRKRKKTSYGRSVRNYDQITTVTKQIILYIKGTVDQKQPIYFNLNIV